MLESSSVIAGKSAGRESSTEASCGGTGARNGVVDGEFSSSSGPMVLGNSSRIEPFVDVIEKEKVMPPTSFPWIVLMPSSSVTVTVSPPANATEGLKTNVRESSDRRKLPACRPVIDPMTNICEGPSIVEGSISAPGLSMILVVGVSIAEPGRGETYWNGAAIELEIENITANRATKPKPFFMKDLLFLVVAFDQIGTMFLVG